MTYPLLFDATTGRFNGVVTCLQVEPEVFTEEEFNEAYDHLTGFEWGFVFFGHERSLERAEEVKSILEEFDDGEYAGHIEVREVDVHGTRWFDVFYRGGAE